MQILESSVFTTERPCSAAELMELKRIVIIRSFLQQELSRRSEGHEAIAVATLARQPEGVVPYALSDR
ncbi:MAG TPA: hypothetical protein VHL58_20085 [Thermoanaerobaculia bacterium]|nr:hypothetical protein [Thermoanaerobaculia bacterium]